MSEAGEDTPISHLVEKLAFNSSLRSLSVCTDRIDSRAALVIEDPVSLTSCLATGFLGGAPHLDAALLEEQSLGHHGLWALQ